MSSAQAPSRSFLDSKWLALFVIIASIIPLLLPTTPPLTDLPGHIEVRTCTKSTYRLLIRKGDDPDAVYVHVAQAGAAWWLRGWLLGSEVQEEWLEAPRGREEAYFVPHPALHPMADLRSTAP